MIRSGKSSAARRTIAAAALEVLERRQLLAGNITGVVFNDLDGDGVRDSGEPGLSGRTVFVDLDRDGLAAGADPVTTSDASGNYSFSGLAAGPYSLSFELADGFLPTAPPNLQQRVLVIDNQTVTAQPMGSFKYNPNIYLDPTFGVAGERIIPISGGAVSVVRMKQLAGGKLLVAGAVGSLQTLWRFNENGSLDTTFGGGDGQLEPAVPTGFVIDTMELSNDGSRILLGGHRPSVRDLEVVALQANGALDLGFTGDGHTAVDFAGSVDLFRDMVVTPDDKIVLVGYRELLNPMSVVVDTEIEVAQLLPTGLLDTTFSGDGRATFDLNSFTDIPTSVAVESDSQILVAGYRMLSGRDVGLVFRVNSNGTEDFTYGTGGARTVESTGASVRLNDIAVQPNDRAIVVGEDVPTGGGVTSSIVARLTTVGAFDGTFDVDGRQSFFFGGFGSLIDSRGTSVAINGSGLIAVGAQAGGALPPGDRAGIFLVNSAGQLERASLRAGGLAHEHTGSDENDSFSDLALLNDGRVLAVSEVAGGTKLGLIRTTTNIPLSTISGTVFNDLNNNGVREAGEGPSVGRTVYIDENQNVVRDANEQFAVTDANGNYSIPAVIASAYFVRLTAPQGFVQSDPPTPDVVDPEIPIGDPILAVLVAGQSLGLQNFGLHEVPPTLTVSANGPYSVGEGDVVQLLGTGSAEGASITAYEWDFDYDGVTFNVDSTLQNPLFSAANLDGVAGSPGTTRTVGLRIRSGTFPASSVSTAVVTINNVAPTALFGNNGPINIGGTGTVSFSMQTDPSAADRAAGFKYSFDFGNDGTFEIVDSTNATASVPGNLTAAAGSVGIAGRIADKDGGVRTYTTTLVVNEAPAPGSINGLVFNDIDRDGQQDAGEAGIAGRTVYVDADNDGVLDGGETSVLTSADGTYSITGVAPATVFVRQVVPSGLVQTLPAGNAARQVNVSSGQASLNVNFATAVAPAGATLRGVVFLDTDRDGVRDSGEAGVSNRSIYLDNNNNGVRDSSEPQTATNSSGAYEFTGLAAGTYKIRQILPAGFIQTAPSNNFGNNATVSGTQVRENLNFGTDATSAPQGATLRGVVFLDTDRDGVRDPGEAGVSDRTIYLDNNNNGARDSSEPQTTTNSSGAYEFTGLSAGTYKIRQILPAGFTQTTPSNNFGNNATVSGTQVRENLNFGTIGSAPQPATGSISGFLFSDTNGNGVQDGNEGRIGDRVVFLDADRDGQLDSNERQTTTNSNGEYSFGNLAPGTYRVRRVLPGGFRISTPTAGFHDVAVAEGQSVTGRNFGATDRVLISGQVFEDKDGDRIKDGNEGGLGGWRVFIDTDNDGVFDANERNIITGTDGNYAFNDLVAGTYRVRVVQQSGFTRTTPTSGVHQVTLSAGATAQGRLFGQRRI